VQYTVLAAKTVVLLIQGESQNFCHCVHATNYKFVFIKNTVILLSLEVIEKSCIPLCQICLLQSFSIIFSFMIWFIKVSINKTIDSLIPKSSF